MVCGDEGIGYFVCGHKYTCLWVCGVSRYACVSVYVYVESRVRVYICGHSKY